MKRFAWNLVQLHIALELNYYIYHSKLEIDMRSASMVDLDWYLLGMRGGGDFEY